MNKSKFIEKTKMNPNLRSFYKDRHTPYNKDGTRSEYRGTLIGFIESYENIKMTININEPQEVLHVT